MIALINVLNSMVRTFFFSAPCRSAQRPGLSFGHSAHHAFKLHANDTITMYAQVAGRVRVGACAWLGIGCTIIQCLSIGQHSIVGAGAVVIRDVPDFATVVGVPARVIKTNPPPDADPVIE